MRHARLGFMERSQGRYLYYGVCHGLVGFRESSFNPLQYPNRPCWPSCGFKLL